MDTNVVVKYHQEQMKALEEAIQYLHDMKDMSEDKGDKKIYRSFANAARYAFVHLGKERPVFPSYFGRCTKCGGDLITKGRKYSYCPWCGQRVANYEPLSYELYRPEITRFYNEEENYDSKDDYIPRNDEPANEQPYELPSYIRNAADEWKAELKESGEYDGFVFNED